MTKAEKAKAMLVSMRELLASKNAWCQGNQAQNLSRDSCLPGDPTARTVICR